MKKVKIISFTASMVLAMVFTFSCSSDDGGGNNSSGPGGDGGGENTYNNRSSSSNKGGSSSSSNIYNGISSSSSQKNVACQDKNSGYCTTVSSEVCQNLIEGTYANQDWQVVEKCPSSSSSGAIRFCNEGYNEITEFCVNDKVYEKCNNEIYNPASYGCCNNEMYDIATYRCCNNKAYRFYGQGCCNNEVYSTETHICRNSIIYPKGICNGKTYDQELYACIDDVLVSTKCGNKSFNPIIEFCLSNSNNVYTKCNGEEYNPLVQKCVDNFLKIPCGSGFYDSATEFCSDGIVNYKGEFTDARDGTRYKTVVIGEQTWMAENLNYDAEGSKCYKDDSNNCTKYGRLYTSAKAMTICPASWHLPTKNEWMTLHDYVGFWTSCGSSLSTQGNAKILTAAQEWDDYFSNGDYYGFSALLGGYGTSSYQSISYQGIGSIGSWWSATADNSVNRVEIYKGTFNFFCHLSGASYLSVRCVQD